MCLLLFCLLLCFCLGDIPKMKLVLLDDRVSKETGALCLDGSSPGFYINRTSSSSKFIVFLNGGGWCTSPSDCLARSKTHLGSSHYWGPFDDDQATGVFDDNATTNPYFYDWNKVYVQYCDGASFSGNKTDPLVVDGVPLYFRGVRILEQLFRVLFQQWGLSQASDILLTGCSAGGLSAFLHADRIGHWVSTMSRAHRYKVAPISGFFLRMPNLLNASVYDDQIVSVYQMQNCSVHPLCLALHPHDPHMCMFAENVFPVTKSPLFIQHSMYDAWNLQYIFTVDMPDSNKWASCIANITMCTLSQIRTMNSIWQVAFMERVMRPDKFWNPDTGCYLHSIVSHCGGGMELWNGGIEIGGVRVNQAWGEWFNDLVTTSRYIGCTLHEQPPYQCSNLSLTL